MKVLIFEYINGGGFAGKPMPSSLAKEGGMMLQALLDELKDIPDLQVILPLDRRCHQFLFPSACEVVWVEQANQLFALLTKLIARCDAVWPIAPETAGVLFDVAKITEQEHKTLLLSDAPTVAICADKLRTYRMLADAGIDVVETVPLIGCDARPPFPQTVLKPYDGVGCEGSFVANNPAEYAHALRQIGTNPQYLVQPYLRGESVSLSCLFKNGKSWLLSCNQQLIKIENGSFHLDGCLVNVDNPKRKQYEVLSDRVAQALRGLWGYIGIDIIETLNQSPVILEINPRLTTSYVGLHRATGINVAQQVLNMLDGEPELMPLVHQSIQVSVN